MTTSRGITDTRVYDREGVVERYGIPPELVTDFIGLKGDTSDNIPGVPGIGDKTAAQLLQKYGSLESVLEHVDEISGEKRRQNLRENADLARISKSLATLHRGIDAGRRRGRDRRPRARPLTAARGLHPLRAARPAAPAGGGAGRAGGGAAGRRASGASRPRVRETTPAGIAELGDAVALAVAGGRREHAALGGARRRASRCSPVPPRRSRRCWRPWGGRSLVAHDWKALRRDAGDGEAAGRGRCAFRTTRWWRHT